MSTRGEIIWSDSPYTQPLPAMPETIGTLRDLQRCIALHQNHIAIGIHAEGDAKTILVGNELIQPANRFILRLAADAILAPPVLPIEN